MGFVYMLTVQIEVDGRTLGGNELTDAWLGENSCRHLLAHVLAEHHPRPNFLATVHEVKLMCKKQQETTMNRLDIREFANATPCMDISLSAITVALNPQSFHFKLASSILTMAQAAPSSWPLANAFAIIQGTQAEQLSLPPRLRQSLIPLFLAPD